MKFRDILRIAVLKTNSCWLFSSLNKMPYYLAIKVFVQMCKRFPEIKSVYLRHRLVEGSWTPALSDIDLAVITDSELTTDEEFSFLRSFWENCDRMKKLFPMLGEIEILNDKHIELWTKFGIEGYISGSWMLLYGKVTVKNNFFVGPKRLAIESLNYALGFYLGLFLIKFNQRDEPLYLVLQDLKRLVFKVQRCLDYININESKKPIVAGLLDNKTDMLFCILNGLEQGIRFIIPANNEADPRKNDEEWLAEVDSHNKVLYENQALDVRALAPWDEVIESIILNYNKRIFIVLKDGLDTSAMKGCIDTIRRVFAQEDTMPVIMTFCIFNYMLHHYNPFEYTRFIRHRIVTYGKDLLPDIQPPDKHSFISHLIRQIPTILTFPQSRTLISKPSSDWFSKRTLESVVERSLFLKLHLETGVIEPWHHQLSEECQKHYPEDYKKLHELKKNSGYARDEASSWQAFRLLKGMSNDTYNSISTSNVLDNLFKAAQSENAGR